MMGARTLHLTVVDDTASSRYVTVKGRAREWLRDNAIPAMWSPRVRGFRVRRERLPDLLALADSQGHRVAVREVDR